MPTWPLRRTPAPAATAGGQPAEAVAPPKCRWPLRRQGHTRLPSGLKTEAAKGGALAVSQGKTKNRRTMTRKTGAAPARATTLRRRTDGGVLKLKWKRRPRERAQSCVGLVSETKEQHLARHNGGLHTCPRCRWHKWGATWVATYGSFESITGPREKVIWLAERPPRWGGHWGLGCAVCAGTLHRCRLGAGDPDVAAGGPRLLQ